MPTIRFDTSDKEVEFEDGEDINVLRVSIRNDCGVPWKCASGMCGTDRIRVVEGAENLEAPRRREKDRLGPLLDEGVRLACQTYATGNVTVVWDPDQQGLDEDSKAGKRLKAKWLEDEDAR
jgi:ferredoxin